MCEGLATVRHINETRPRVPEDDILLGSDLPFLSEVMDFMPEASQPGDEARHDFRCGVAVFVIDENLHT